MPIRTRLSWAGLTILSALAVCTSTHPTGQDASAAEPHADRSYEEKVVPLLKKHCFTCHDSEKEKGGLALDVYQNAEHARKDRMTWESVKRAVAAGEMPPKSNPQLTREEKEFLTTWIENSLTKVDCTGPKDPGRVTLRRLNRTEYNNTVRALCGVTITPADAFPADDVGYGFDNIGDVLSLQPILLEKYMAAADRVLDAALPPLGPVPSSRQS